MINKSELQAQITVVLKYLEENYQKNERYGVLELIYNRYRNALQLLDNDTANKDNLNILGGTRAYMDSYSDYSNPLLNEMYKAEKLAKQL